MIIILYIAGLNTAIIRKLLLSEELTQQDNRNFKRCTQFNTVQGHN